MKRFGIISLLFLLAFQCSSAPIPFAFFKPVAASPPAVDYLLDQISASAYTAYSVRKLRAAYAGSAIRVRRASDNAEQDIGFSGEDLDTSALETFCAATDGFVTTRYDQSGNARHQLQATASAQPQIVASGVIITGANSKPAISGDGVNDKFALSASPTEPISFFCVINQDTWTSGDYLVGIQSAEDVGITQSGSSPIISANGESATISPTLDTWFIVQYRLNDNNFLMRLNDNAASTDTSGTIGAANRVISFGSIGTSWDGLEQECIVFAASAPSSTDEDTIRNSQNTYFVVF